MNLNPVDAKLFSLLNGQATLTALAVTGVYNRVPPDNPSFPYVRFHRQEPGTIRHRMKAGKRLVQVVYQVEALDLGLNADRANEIDDAVDDLLSEGDWSGIPGWNVSAVLRQANVDFEEEDGDRFLFHSGGLYRVFLEAQ